MVAWHLMQLAIGKIDDSVQRRAQLECIPQSLILLDSMGTYSKGVTRLGAALVKKQVWLPHV